MGPNRLADDLFLLILVFLVFCYGFPCFGAVRGVGPGPGDGGHSAFLPPSLTLFARSRLFCAGPGRGDGGHALLLYLSILFHFIGSLC